MAYQLGDVLVRTIMENVTGLPEDRVINDFAFATGATAPTTTELAEIGDYVDDFFRAIPSGAGSAVGSWIGEAINRSATHTMEFYSISAAGLGSPILVNNWLGPVAPVDSSNLPTEVAAVLSFHADLTGVQEEGAGGTRPRARRRGRVYIGPLGQSSITHAAENPLISSTLTGVLAAAGNAMRVAADADGLPWCVWSRTDQVLRPITGGWVDNAPDTQRRRGTDATTRSTWGN
jgi:hypothetical protein